MKNLSSWLLVMFIVLFWIFRIALMLSTEYGRDFGGFIVLDKTFEIAMLFITFLCVFMTVKRWIFGGLIYMIGYGYYFGQYIMDNFPALLGGESIDFLIVQNVVVGILAILLGLLVILDVIFEKSKSKHYSDIRTDWFFKNKKTDRQLDERADKNQYRTL